MYFMIYKQNKFHAQLSWAWKKFYNLGATMYLWYWKVPVAKIVTAQRQLAGKSDSM